MIENSVDNEINNTNEEEKTFDIKMIKIMTPGEYPGSHQIQE